MVRTTTLLPPLLLAAMLAGGKVFASGENADAVRARLFVSPDGAKLRVELVDGEVLTGALSGRKDGAFRMLIEGTDARTLYGASGYHRWIAYGDVVEVTASEAHPITPSRDLAARLRVGDEVRVETVGGGVWEGKIEGIDEEHLRLHDRTVDLGEEGPMRIDFRRSDPLWNGGLIGFGVGAGLFGGLVVSICRSEDCDGSAMLQGVLFSGAVGAGIGMLADAFTKKRTTVYVSADGAKTLTLVPYLSRDERGVLLRLRF